MSEDWERSNSAMISECDLPEAMLLEVFRRLPVRGIGKCMLVCKTWNSLIKNHSFIYSHLHHSLLRSSPLHLIRDWYPSYKERYFLFSFLSHRIANLQYSFYLPYHHFLRVVGALNGIVCLCHDFGRYVEDVIFWNPSIRRHLQLPPPLFNSATFGGGYYTVVLGLGFDSNRNDFKVVRVCYPLCDSSSVVPPYVELFSLREGAWRVIDSSNVELRVDGGACQLFFQGNVHWLAYKDTESDPAHNCIMRFNVMEEKFNMMDLPEELGTVSSNSMAISVIEGCLSLINYPLPLKYPSWFVQPSCDIWMLRESWSKVYCIQLDGGFRELLGLGASGEVLVVPFQSSREETMSLRSIDLMSQETRDLGIQTTGNDLFACDFTESLVLLDKESNAAVVFHEETNELEELD